MSAGKVLVLGSTGKVGQAVAGAFADGWAVTGRSRPDFDALDAAQVARVVCADAYDVVVNAAAFGGADRCEEEPQQAFAVNALFPGALADLSRERGFLLVHFSTEAVFGDREEGSWVEDDCPAPPNLYGLTKLCGDYLVQARAGRHYLVRIALQFGETDRCEQFVERMLRRVGEGARALAVAADVVTTPSYSRDVARRVRQLIEAGAPPGLYHVVNDGTASLHELMAEIVARLGLDVEVRPASHRDFPGRARKSVRSPLCSARIAPLRPWREAAAEYCARLLAAPRPPWERGGPPA